MLYSRTIKNIGIGLSILISIGLAGCKPTERNYQEAYAMAINNKKAEQDLNSDIIPAEGFIREGEPTTSIYNGKKVLLNVEPLSLVERENSDKETLKRYNVIVGKFKMTTNANAMAQDLRKRGYDSFYVKGKGDIYYAVAGSCATMEEATSLMEKFRKEIRNFSFIGLDGGMMIVEASNVR